MMIIDIRKLNAQKRYFGEMQFSYQPPAQLLNNPLTQFASSVFVEFAYDLYEDDAFEIRGKVSYRLKGQCARCLKDVETSVEGELNALFEPKKDAEDYSYFGGIVDITKAVEDAVVFSLPFSLSCEEECEPIRYSSGNEKDN